MNATFFDSKAQAGNSEIVKTEHDLFEIGSVGEQDLMIHMAKSTIKSGIETFSREGGFNLTKIWETQYGSPLMLGNQTFKRICLKCS
jgi:hypothetical protein